MDDDVQFLGAKFVTTESLVDPSEQGRATATGIVLHVDKCGDKPAHDLTFHRAHTSYVNIGRKSGSDDRSMRRENDDHNAVFTCQVVSARHAKLVLSDGGQVYIVDLHSRHGTHLSRNGETPPRMLQPEVETLLCNGDLLTFGKVVGAGSYHVSPVTVRVELLTGFSSSSDSSTGRTESSHPSSPVLEVRPRKLSSGRYGLISASIAESDSPKSSSSFISVSSDAASSPSDQESDAEDERACIPLVLRDGQGKVASVKIPAFRSFIREMCHNTVLHSPSLSDVQDEPLEDPSLASPSVDVIVHASPVIVESIPKSRSHSPIYLAMSPPREVQHPEPAVIGAWPASRPDSPCHSSLEVDPEQSEVPLPPGLNRPPEPIPAQPSPSQSRILPPCSTSTLLELVQCLHPQAPFFPSNGPFSNSIASDFGLPSVPPPPLPPPPLPRMPPHFHPLDKVVSERVNSEIRGSFKSVEDRIVVLQETVGDLKSRQTVTEEDVVDLQSHLEMLEPDSERLLCRITGAERNIATLSTMQGQLTTLQNQVTTLRTRADAPVSSPIETPMADLRACADALNNLVSEMRALREDVEERIEAKIEAIQSARGEALDTLREVVAEVESIRSLKRKREDEDSEEETPALEVAATAEPAACSPPVIVADIPRVEVCLPEIPIVQIPTPLATPVIGVPASEIPTLEPTRPKKRVRTAVYTIARTATAIAIGAAATWSALAFS